MTDAAEVVVEETKPKRKPGRPRKKVNKVPFDAPNAPKTENGSTVGAMVDAVIDNIEGYAAKYNRVEALSVVDLGTQAAPQGIKFRQLHVKLDAGFITISIQEGFKSSHGGSEQRKTINAFRVSMSDSDSISKLQRRFFNYAPTSDYDEATRLLDTLTMTVAST
jgi:hypothetical protein